MKRAARPPRGPARQRGATLVVALVFLVLMSLFAVQAFLSSSTELRIVGNMQARNEGIAAAQVAIEQALEGNTFANQPDQLAATPVTVDMDRNGTPDYTVRFTPRPTCYRIRPVKNSELDATRSTDVGCIRSGTVQTPGMELADPASAGLMADNSLCADTDWNLRADVTDARTGLHVAVNQGVSVRMIAADAAANCN